MGLVLLACNKENTRLQGSAAFFCLWVIKPIFQEATTAARASLKVAVWRSTVTVALVVKALCLVFASSERTRFIFVLPCPF